MKLKTIFITFKAEMTEKFEDYTTNEKYFDPYPTVPNEKGSQLCSLFRAMATTIKRNLSLLLLLLQGCVCEENIVA